MSKEFKAGISYTADTGQLVVVEISDGDVTVLHVEEQIRSSESETWFLDILGTVDAKTLSKLTSLSVAIDHASACVLRFPIDSTLNQIDQNEQVQWEFSQLLKGEVVRDLINDVHVLRANSKEQVTETLAVGYNRPQVFAIQKACAARQVNLHFVDLTLFAAEHALWFSYPDLRSGTLCLLEVGPQISVASILSRGRMAAYHSTFVTDPDGVVRFADSFINRTSVETIVVYGTAVTYEMVKALRAEFGHHAATINPFRRMKIDADTQNYERFIGLEHHFVAATGSAIRSR